MLGLYQYYFSFRGGEFQGTFVCDKDDISKLYGKNIYFGEVLGKHSELSVHFDESDFKLLTDDQEFISKYATLVGDTGYNPFDYLPQEYEDDEDED